MVEHIKGRASLTTSERSGSDVTSFGIAWGESCTVQVVKQQFLTSNKRSGCES